ncbi:hypothetical protein FK519_27465, partial [Klebsiella pneumoniae]|nr:hypothetical protein [Klebsiella pneumoniae]
MEKKIQIGCRMVNGSIHEKATQIIVRRTNESVLTKSLCVLEKEKLECWSNFTLTQPVFVICLWNNQKGDVALTFKFKMAIIEPTTTTPSPNMTRYTAPLTTEPVIVLNPKIFEIGPYVIRNMGQQQMLFNPSWSLKQVELSMQNNASEIQPACSPFLKTSYEGWTTWLQKRTPSEKRI